MCELGLFITNGTDAPFYVRRVLDIEKNILKATAKVCGLGQFEFHINGQKVGDHELDPGWTDYRKYVEYVTFDVTGYLRRGKNAVGAEIGNGWYIMNREHYSFDFPAFMPPNPNPYHPFGKQLVFAMRLELLYADGTAEVFTAGEGFRTAPHPVLQSNVYGSETIDATRFRPGWDTAGFDDSDWSDVLVAEDAPVVGLVEQFQPPVKVIRRYAPTLLGTVNGREIYDIGQNISGVLELCLRGRKGDFVRVYPAEKLGQDGDVDQVMKGWTTLDAVITFILGEDDVWQRFRMKFTYFAGKVLAVERSRPGIELSDMRADAISSAWKASGSFRCDDERYQKVYDMIERTVEANMLSVHTDCPTIERFAWQEPNHLMAPAILFMKDGRGLWDKFLIDMRAGQHSAKDVFYDFEGRAFPAGDGLVPSQCPCYIPNVLPVPGMGSFYDIIPWGSALILGARWHYRFYGDLRILAENFDAGLRYLNYLRTKVNADGFINHGLGDWGNPSGAFARENVETAFLYADAVALAEAADALGRPEGGELRAYAEGVKNNYNAKLLRRGEDGRYAYYSFDQGALTQACEAIPLYFGMVPEAAERDVADALRRTLEEAGCFAAGEVGLPYIIQTAARYGMNSLIARFVVRKEHPSYYAFILAGMTTLGEYWEDNPRSHCHDMMGHIVEWYYNGIAGIQPLEPGFRRICVKPFLPEGMNGFDCRYDSASGRIRVKVRREKDAINLRVETDAGIVCEIDTSQLESLGHVNLEK